MLVLLLIVLAIQIALLVRFFRAKDLKQEQSRGLAAGLFLSVTLAVSCFTLLPV